MKKSMTKGAFCCEMSENSDNGFTYEGASMLWDYLEEVDDDIEYDPIAFRCEYAEYTLEEYEKEYPQIKIDYVDCLDEHEGLYEEGFLDFADGYDDNIISIDYDNYIILRIN